MMTIAFSSMTGYPKERIQGRPFTEFVLDRGMHYSFSGTAWPDKADLRKHTRYHDTILNAAGGAIDAQIDWDFKHDENGSFCGIIAVITDISERKLSETLAKVEHDAAIQLSAAGDITVAARGLTAALMQVPGLKAACLYLGNDLDMELQTCLNIPDDLKTAITTISAGSAEHSLLMTAATEYITMDELPGALKNLRDAEEFAAASIFTMGGSDFAASLLCLFGAATVPRPVLNTLETIAAHAESAIKKMLAENALKESEARYRSLVEKMNDGLFIVDSSNRTIYANTRFCDMIGYSAEEILGAPITRFMDNLNKRVLAMIMDSGAVEGYGSVNVEWKAKNGSAINTLVSPQVISGGRAAAEERFAVVTDITEHKKMEQELIKIQKLESLSLLAGGIAHDYNNILTGILGNVNMAKTNIDRESDLYTILDEAEQASLKARDISRQLLTFAKGGDPVKKNLDVRDIIYNSASFALRGSNVSSEFTMAQNLWNIEADEAQISQVIDNVIINAKQAMPEGGMISIWAENTMVKKKDHLPIHEGKYVTISIRDRGPGIPQEFNEKIFDLFFTTKEKGNGIGLATSFSIMKRHSGHICYESKPGDGTTFHIYIPASESQQLQEVLITQKNDMAARGRALVMDDEEIIRKTSTRMLGKIGYSVDTARDGKEAIEMYTSAARANSNYDIVLMDLTVPGGMGGREAAEKILELFPAACIIATSGYTNETIQTDYASHGFKNFLPKPFTIDDLASIITMTIPGQ
jgi:PAS domain S-box-containing protein